MQRYNFFLYCIPSPHIFGHKSANSPNRLPHSSESLTIALKEVPRTHKGGTTDTFSYIVLISFLYISYIVLIFVI